MGKKINIRPSSSVYATYKRLSYQPWTAIAEFIDNSTQSFYDHKEELLSIKYSKGLQINIDYIDDPINGDRIEILDNAFGMEWNDFQRAIILDKPPINTSGRNEFGMGLKTAACWFGTLWSVESTQLNSKNKYFAEMNINELGKYKTEEIDVREEVVSLKEHYTKIVIKNLNQKIYPRTIGKVKELLGSIYRMDFRSGDVKIFYNGTALQFKEVDVYVETINGEKHEWKKDVSFNVNYEGKTLTVKGFIAIRIPGSVKGAGFTLFRRGRVIYGGTENNYRPVELFGDSNSFPYQRLYGELHMDNWTVTQAKDNFDWHNSDLEDKFIKELEIFSREYRNKTEKIRIREKVKTDEIVKKAVEDLKKSVDIEDVEFNIINKNNEFINENQVDDKCEEVVDINDEGVIFDGGSQVDFKFKYKNEEYLFHVILDINNQNSPWLLLEQNNSIKNEFTLTINMRHSFFKPLIDKKDFHQIMFKICIALALAEIKCYSLSPEMNNKINPSDIRMKMNDILEEIRKGDENDE